jgi:negative regulator of genetic competence, sporulation and motility
LIIEKLSSLTIKVSITENELSEYALSFDSLNSSDSRTKEFIMYVLREIRSNLGINLCNENLYIEAFSCINKDCILYISAVDLSISDDTENTHEEAGFIIFEATDPHKLIRFSEDIKRYFDEYCISSRLYHHNNVFRLFIELDCEKADSMIDTAFTHGLKYSSDNIIAAKTEEYFVCVIEENAVGKLSGQVLL